MQTYIIDYPQIAQTGMVVAFEAPPYAMTLEDKSSTAWFYATQMNDTLEVVAERFGFDSQKLNKVNNNLYKKDMKIEPGTMILFPAPPTKGRTYQSDDNSEIDSAYFYGNKNGPDSFVRCCNCQKSDGLLTHTDFWDLKLCMLCWVKRWVSEDPACCCICAKLPPADGWNGCELCVKQECTVILCPDCEKKHPFINVNNEQFCLSHGVTETVYNKRRSVHHLPEEIVIGKHNPSVLFSSIVDMTRRDRMTQIETIEQSVRINALGFTKTNSWFDEVKAFLQKSPPQQKAFLSRRLVMRQQQQLDSASFLQRAKRITKQMGWNELAESINDKRSLKKLCKLCFICSQRQSTSQSCEDGHCLFLNENQQAKDLVFDWWLLSAVRLLGKSTGDAKVDSQLVRRFNRNILQVLGLFPINKQRTARLQFLRRALAAVKEGFVIEMNNFAILSKQDHVPVKDAASSRFMRATAQITLPPELDALKPKKDDIDDEESIALPRRTLTRKRNPTDQFAPPEGKKQKSKPPVADSDAFSILLASNAKTSKYASMTGEVLYENFKDDPVLFRTVPAADRQKNIENLKTVNGFDFFTRGFSDLIVSFHPDVVKTLKSLMFEVPAQVYENQLEQIRKAQQ